MGLRQIPISQFTINLNNLVVNCSRWTPKCIHSENTQEIPERLYTIVPIVVCHGFKIIWSEKINLPNGKNEGSYSNQGQDYNNGTSLLSKKIKRICVDI